MGVTRPWPATLRMKDAKRSQFEAAGAVGGVVVSAACTCFQAESKSAETNLWGSGSGSGILESNDKAGAAEGG